MAYELFYTSAPRGLRPQTSGICTVGMTRGFPSPFIPRLEALSGYRPPYEGAQPNDCPVAYSHWIVEAAGVTRHVLAAVRATHPDHTLRNNKLAHYLLLRERELFKIGPAWILSQPGVMASEWVGEPREIEDERKIPDGSQTKGGRCHTWEKFGRDAGWAGVIANAAMLEPSTPCSIVYPKGTPVLDLVNEALLLLPPEWRWRVTFSTYFMEPLAGLRCAWRFCLDGTDAATAARQSGGLTVDLCARSECTRKGRFIDAARTGVILAFEPHSSLGFNLVPQQDQPYELSSALSSADMRAPPTGDSQQFSKPPLRAQSERFDVGRGAGRERLTTIACISAAFFLTAFVVVLFLWMQSRKNESELSEQLVRQSISPPSPPTPATPLSEIDAKRALDEALQKNKVLEEQLAAVETSKNQPVESVPTPVVPDVEAIPDVPIMPVMEAIPAVPPPAEIGIAASMPTAIEEWKTFKVPVAAKGRFGGFEGDGKIAEALDLDRVVWFPDAKTKLFECSDSKIFLIQNAKRYEVAVIEIVEKEARFRWTATAETVAMKSDFEKSVVEHLRTVAIVVIHREGPPEWFVSQRIRAMDVFPETPMPISNSNNIVQWKYSIDGEQWADFDAGGPGTKTPTTVPMRAGTLVISSKKFPPQIDFELKYPTECDGEKIKELDDAVLKARGEVTSAETDLAAAKNTAGAIPSQEERQDMKQAKVDLNTAKSKFEDAQKQFVQRKKSQLDFLQSLEDIRVLVVPTGQIPVITLHFKNSVKQKQGK